MKIGSRTDLRLLAMLAAGCASERPAHEGERGATAAHRTSPPAAPRGPSAPTPVAPPLPPAPLHAKARFVWIQAKPDAGSEWIGYLWTGGSVARKSTDPFYGPGCDSPWYEIEPRGFVCSDEKRASIDPDDAESAALRAFTPNTDSAWPFRYGESLGLVRYRELPSPEIQARNESDLPRHLKDLERARAGQRVKSLLGVDVSLPDIAPPSLPLLARSVHEARAELKLHSTVAYTTEARWGNRGFLLSADYGWIPKDRVREYPKVAFHGVHLGAEARLPLAFFRTQDRPKYARLGDRFTPAAGIFRRLDWVELTGASVVEDGVRYLETREPGIYVKESDAVVPSPPERTPWSTALADGAAGHEHDTWIDVSILGGWLLAFEGVTPRFATLISPGRGGKPVRGRPILETASTPLGSYTINTKIVTATMEAPHDFVHSDVPWVQNFTGPYALHTAYWHDEWGDGASGGCVNLSPLDARFLFDFTEPKLPPGWHAVRREAGGPMTRVILHL
ncbi:MAG TPA: L,D-transpeptidase [Polyangiaceae bacterium]|nr:L,D-transpeptidase [Polyangiaceae bacterium]